MTKPELETKVAMGLALGLVFVLTLSAAAQPRPRPQDEWDYHSTPQVTQRAFNLGAAPEITVNNITGPITVTGDGGTQVSFTATETIEARSQSALERGEREVHLDVTPSGSGLELYVDGPFRCGHDCTNFHDPDYMPKFTFVLHVPRGSSVDLRTVTGGTVSASDVTGGFSVHNVNGDVELNGVAGAGAAATVNGNVEVHFSGNPNHDSQFHSVNGRISLYLQPGLNADLHFKTVNGDVYSDFDTTPIATKTDEGRNGHMIVFRRGRLTAARIGAGGPTLDLNTVNGNIYLHEAK